MPPRPKATAFRSLIVRATFSSKPILHVQAADTFELVGIVGHDRGAGRIGVGGDQQVVGADWLSGRFQLRADSAVFGIGRNIERQQFDLAEQVFDCLEQPFRAALCACVAQLGRHDDAGADVALAHLGDPLRSSALRVPDQVGNDVRVQHVAGQSTFSGAGTGSSISGKSSSSGFIVLSKAMSPRLRTGSITKRSPSRYMIPSLTGCSNSTGIRTAW